MSLNTKGVCQIAMRLLLVIVGGRKKSWLLKLLRHDINGFFWHLGPSLSFSGVVWGMATSHKKTILKMSEQHLPDRRSVCSRSQPSQFTDLDGDSPRVYGFTLLHCSLGLLPNPLKLARGHLVSLLFSGVLTILGICLSV